MWIYNNGKKTFAFGQYNFKKACEAAEKCGSFIQDYEEECFEENKTVCYNCKYRRWTQDSFECMKRR